MLSFIVVLALLLAVLVVRRRASAPRLHCGSAVARIVDAVPLLHARLPRPLLLSSSLAQLFVLAVQMELQEWFCAYEFDREQLDVELDSEGERRSPDSVTLAWLRRADEASLARDAPIVLVLPGLCCHECNLPGTHLYRQLLQRPWRVSVFLKRGIAAPLRSPAVDIFGHPTDLEACVRHISARHPNAPVHIVSYSSGNGLACSFAALHDASHPAVASYCLLCGGCDYRHIYPERPSWQTDALFEKLLVPSVQTNLLAPSEALLRWHDAAGYAKAMNAKHIQPLYDAIHAHFGGYATAAEAEAKTNGVVGGNARLCDTLRTPYLHVYCDDDPVAPGGPAPSWLPRFEQDGATTCCALFPHGSHLACFDSLDVRVRWVDKLVVQWIDAVQRQP